MKKFTAILLALTLIFTLAACGTETVVVDNTGSSETDTGDTTSNTTPDTDEVSSKNDTSSDKADDKNDNKEEDKKPETSSKAPTSSKNSHTHKYTSKVTAATCTEKGYTTYTCACGDSYKGNETPAGHNFSGYVCRVCGAANKEASLSFLDGIIEQNGYDGATMSKEYRVNDGIVLVRDYYTNILVRKSGFKGSDKYEYEINLTKETFKVTIAGKSANGKLDFASFTKTSKVSAKADFVDAASEAIHSLLADTISDFKAANINLKLADFGFKVY